MMSFLSQMFKSTDNAVATADTDEMGLGRLAQMRAHTHAAEDSQKDILSRVKSSEVGASAQQMRFRKPEVKTPLYGGWDALRRA